MRFSKSYDNRGPAVKHTNTCIIIIITRIDYCEFESNRYKKNVDEALTTTMPKSTTFQNTVKYFNRK